MDDLDKATLRYAIRNVLEEAQSYRYRIPGYDALYDAFYGDEDAEESEVVNDATIAAARNFYRSAWDGYSVELDDAMELLGGSLPNQQEA